MIGILKGLDTRELNVELLLYVREYRFADENVVNFCEIPVCIALHLCIFVFVQIAVVFFLR
jgi:hypothetical protein